MRLKVVLIVLFFKVSSFCIFTLIEQDETCDTRKLSRFPEYEHFGGLVLRVPLQRNRISYLI